MGETIQSQGMVRQDLAQTILAQSQSHVRLIFGLVISAVFLDVVDFSIVQVALPSIRTQFLVSLPDSQWIVGAYGITMAGFLMLSGRMGDIYGQKKLFNAGIIIFTIASLTGGFAPSLLSLVVSRAVQGIGAAICSVTALAIFMQLFPEGEERNRALGIFIAVISAGFAAGSVAGGFLTVTLGWRSVMFINVPIGIVTLVLSQKFLPGVRGRLEDKRLDLSGALLVTSGLILLVYALTSAADRGLVSLQTIIPLLLSILVLAGFLVVESVSEAPLMPLGFLRRGSILTANILAVVMTSTVAGLSFIITIYLQQVLGYSALEAGLGFLPLASMFFIVGGWGASRLMNRYGTRKLLIVSSTLIAIGSTLLTQISEHGNYYGILPGMILWSLGASIGFPALNIAALSGAKPGEEGLASGLITTSSRVGFPLGLAVLLTVANVAAPSPAGQFDVSAVVTGFRYALLASALLGVLATIIALRLKDNPHSNYSTSTF